MGTEAQGFQLSPHRCQDGCVTAATGGCPSASLGLRADLSTGAASVSSGSEWTLSLGEQKGKREPAGAGWYSCRMQDGIVAGESVCRGSRQEEALA